MKAKTINHAVVFDWDDTLIKSNAKTQLFNNNKFIKSLTPKEYNNYKYTPGDILDNSDFNDVKLILSSTPYIMWTLFNKLYKENVDIYILTARHKVAKEFIHKFLLNKNINIPIENIFTIGNKYGSTNVPHKKFQVLQKIVNNYIRVDFYDDNANTINYVKKFLSSLNAYLIY